MSETLPPRPIPGARPPHLPDVLTRQSPFVYAFFAVALLQVWRGWELWVDVFPIARVDAIPDLLRLWIPSVVVPLYGVALFLRHPDARRTMPLLVVGLALLTAGELLTAFDMPIRQLLPGPRSFPEFEISAADTAFSVFSGLVALFGVLYVGAGLAAARRAVRSTAERPLSIWLGALAVVSIVLSLIPLTELIGRDYPATVLVAGAIGIVLSVLLTFAWVYLAAVGIGGWLARDEPRRAWICAGASVGLLFVTRLVVSAIGLIGSAAYGVAVTATYVAMAAWLLLLAGFALGLPAPPNAASADVETDAMGDPPAATQPGSVAG
ncbi:MAG TPA: hypothetical protein VHK05_08290 [Candidatus Limnocylindrales bacterium]|nr:hypothetical protein [Candidatus Limnocylindrales bacterium]